MKKLKSKFKRGQKLIYTNPFTRQEFSVVCLFPVAYDDPGFTVVQFSPQQHDGLCVQTEHLRAV